MKSTTEVATGFSSIISREGMMSRSDCSERLSRISRTHENDEPGSIRARRRRAAGELPSLTITGMRPASRERQCTMERESLYLIERRVMQLEGISKIEVVLGGKMGLKEYKNR